MTADFLGIASKRFLVMGVANKRSVAWHVGSTLAAAGAEVAYTVRTAARRESTARLLQGSKVFICDVERQEEIARLAEDVRAAWPRIDGLLHSIAFADYEGGPKPFHETSKEQFLRAADVSCYSLIALAGALKDVLAEDASVVTISISTTRMAVEAYGYMAPAKAALDSSVAFLAKSFSRFSQVRFNAVCAGLLKTSASAGIPGYIDHFMFAERATLRKRGLSTEEVAGVAAFLLSGRSSGINGQGIVVDAGMGTNYFDAEIVKHTLAGVWPAES